MKRSAALKGHSVSEETREKIRRTKMGERNPAKRADVREKMSQTRQGMYVGEKNPFYGRQHTEETKQKISAARKGKGTGKDNGNYGGLSEEVKAKISKALKGKMTGEKNPMFGRIGSKHPRWCGGKTQEKYGSGFTRILKQFIRQRDGFQCQRCVKPEEENGQALDIHHIDYDKRNHNKSNLIALCHTCNAAVNSNRKMWQEYFSGIQSQKLYASA